MQKFPDLPFMTKDFSPRGGGIDFLGMRWVNLSILAIHLIPGINNQTSDFGTYCLGTWIPWKFYQLCKNRKAFFKLSRYRSFREFVEVAISHTMRDQSPSNGKFGKPNNRFGIGQELAFPGKLGFKVAKRTNSTSIYAAPLYGPSLHYLQLISGDAASEDGKITGIPLVSEDKETETIISEVERELRKSKYYPILDDLTSPEVKSFMIDALGNHGLNPAFYRQCRKNLKVTFIKKLLPTAENAQGYCRTLTAKLLIKTVQDHGPMGLSEIYAVWHTGLLLDGRPNVLADPLLNNQREIWSIFQGRQYQRYIMELFLLCFELALKDGSDSIEEIVENCTKYWRNSSAYPYPASFHKQLMFESAWLKKEMRIDAISIAWNKYIHGGHSYYENIEGGEHLPECARACKMLARWFLRTVYWFREYKNKELLTLGGRDRISMKYLSDWIMERENLPMKKFLHDLLSELVFSQHLRIALGRFDGQVQRLRFILGDTGITPTTSVGKELGKNLPSWMGDRLQCFVRLLIDLSVINKSSDDHLRVDENAHYVN